MRSSPRQVDSLKWARSCSWPRGIPPARPRRGTKALGLRFERRVAEALGPLACHGQWFEFWDKNGRGFCQPDIVFQHRGNVYVLEVKLTDTETAKIQLSGLYLPVVTMALGQTARGIIVTRHLTKTTDLNLVVDSLKSAIELTQDLVPVLHYLGKGPI